MRRDLDRAGVAFVWCVIVVLAISCLIVFAITMPIFAGNVAGIAILGLIGERFYRLLHRLTSGSAAR